MDTQKRCGTCDFYIQFRCRWLFKHPRPEWVAAIVTHAPVRAEDDGVDCPAWEP